MLEETPGEWSDFIRRNLPGSANVALHPIYGGGSSRSFYRVGGASCPAVLVANPKPPADTRTGVNENDTYVYVAGILAEIGAGPPEVYAYDRERGLILLEDVGDRHFQTEVLERGMDSAWTEEAYLRLLEVLAVVQVEGGRLFEPVRSFNSPYDGPFMYRAEGLYFADYFVERLCRNATGGLRGELERLAGEAGSSIKLELLLYRDFQSRNILLSGGLEFRLLDFQGARLGPPAYDLASLVYDPYVPLSEQMRARLVRRYGEILASRLGQAAANEFYTQFPFIATHRLMQVLGAYAKLALVDGKRHGLEYVPQALGCLRRLLRDERFKGYPVLGATVVSLERSGTVTEAGRGEGTI